VSGVPQVVSPGANTWKLIVPLSVPNPPPRVAVSWIAAPTVTGPEAGGDERGVLEVEEARLALLSGDNDLAATRAEQAVVSLRGGAQVGRIGGGFRTHHERAEVGAPDFKATCSDSVQVFATRQEGDGVACAGEKTAIQSADPPGPDNRNPHRRQYRRDLTGTGRITIAAL